MLKKLNTNEWLVDIRPTGAGGKRFRKKFTNQAEAKNWETWAKNEVKLNRAWMPERRDLRKLTDLVEIWWKAHGNSLASGKDTKARLLAMSHAMGNVVAAEFNVQLFTKYRHQRVEAGISKSTLNRELAYLRALFSELKRVGEWKKDNPIGDLRQFKVKNLELSYLTSENIRSLFDELERSRNPHALLITKICLSTGGRWSEAQGLRHSHLLPGRVVFTDTKNGKVREVKINKELEAEIRAHIKKGLVEIPEGDSNPRIFANAYDACRKALERTGIYLPDGQLTHVLRHTFASSFIQKGGNAVVLQRILGQSSLSVTQRYTHLAPNHLDEAMELNPLVDF